MKVSQNYKLNKNPGSRFQSISCEFMIMIVYKYKDSYDTREVLKTTVFVPNQKAHENNRFTGGALFINCMFICVYHNNAFHPNSQSNSIMYNYISFYKSIVPIHVTLVFVYLHLLSVLSLISLIF